MSRSAAAGGTARLFVACDFPAEALHAIETWQERELGGREGLKINHALHLTLAFLGNVETARIPAVEAALRPIAWDAVPARFGGPLFLPRHGRKQVLALELLTEGDGLRELHAEVSGALAREALYDPGKRPWLPHVTVARFRRPGHPFSLQNVNNDGFCVVRMVLYSSLLERAGAVHTPVAVFPAS